MRRASRARDSSCMVSGPATAVPGEKPGVSRLLRSRLRVRAQRPRFIESKEAELSRKTMSEEARVSGSLATPGRLAWLLHEQRGAVMERWTRRVLLDPTVPNANRLSRPA